MPASADIFSEKSIAGLPRCVNPFVTWYTGGMKYALLFFLLAAPAFSLAADLNAGFVRGLWYSKTPFFAGETVRVYTAIQNNSGFDIQGTVRFLVDGETTGESSFSAGQGKIAEAWTDWEVSQGNHDVSAQIAKAFKLEIGKTPEPINLANSLIGTSQVFADRDTDKDGRGDAEDPDDDNDLLADETEKELGTDPLNADSDGDGVSDSKEVALGTDPLKKDAANQQATEQQPQGPQEPKEGSFVQDAAAKLTQEYLPALKLRVDETATTAAEQLKEQRKILAQKKEEMGELPAQEQAFDMLLASAIVGLERWQLALFLAFGVIVALALGRLARKEEQAR